MAMSQDFQSEGQKALMKSEHEKDKVEIPDNAGRLELKQMIGFNGSVKAGLIVHADGCHLIYPVGQHIVVEDLRVKGGVKCGEGVGKQELLVGHTDAVSCLCQSKDGRFLASGQVIPSGWRAPVILWDFASRSILMKTPSHMESVIAIAFNRTSEYFITLGSATDGKITVWSTNRREPICGSAAQLGRAGPTRVLATSKADSAVFVTAGDFNGRIWTVDSGDKKLDCLELNFGPVKREIICIEIADVDNLDCRKIFCGTTSGDVLVFNVTNGFIQANIPAKKLHPLGVTALTFVRMLDDMTFNLLVGTGEGYVGSYNFTLTYSGKDVSGKAVLAKDTQLWTDVREKQPVTSIAKLGPGKTFYVGTRSDHIYEFNLYKMEGRLFRTGNRHPILALTFARGTDDLMLTSSFEQVRVYNLSVGQEVRRFVRSNMSCHCLVVNHDGTQVFTGWDAGDVLVLGFHSKDFSLKELYRIHIAQKKTVTCLALTSQSAILVTGGDDGQGRVWRLVEDLDMRGQRLRQAVLLHILTAQIAPITSLQMSADDKQCVSASTDGTVVVYDVVQGAAMYTFKVGGHVTEAAFCCGGFQVLAAAHMGTILQFEMLTNSVIRELVGVQYGATRGLTVCDPKGLYATGGDDTLLKMWRVDSGELVHVGVAHSKVITKVKVGPCGTLIVSGCQDGSICVWRMP